MPDQDLITLVAFDLHLRPTCQVLAEVNDELITQGLDGFGLEVFINSDGLVLLGFEIFLHRMYIRCVHEFV